MHTTSVAALRWRQTLADRHRPADRNRIGSAEPKRLPIGGNLQASTAARGLLGIHIRKPRPVTPIGRERAMREAGNCHTRNQRRHTAAKVGVREVPS